MAPGERGGVETCTNRCERRYLRAVRLACGEVSGVEPLGTNDEYACAWVHLTSGFVPQTLADGACGYGRHEATRDAPFSITVRGAPYASYGYAGGMGSRPLNEPPPPTVQ